MKLTKSIIDKLEYQGKDEFYWDDEIKGFGIKITRTGKSYIIQSRVNGRTIRKKLSPSSSLTPEEARKEAKIKLGEIARGVDINKKDKDDKLKKKTLQDAFSDYKETKNIREKTLKEYERAMRMSFDDWKNKPIISINRNMIEKKFSEISARTKSVANSDFRFLRALINYAMEKYLIKGEPIIPSNPCNILTSMKLWNRVDRKRTYISEKNLPNFFKGLEIIDNDRDVLRVSKNQCFFIILTGCREQEAARLKWRDVDFSEKTITFNITKNHHKHILPIGDRLYDFLKKLSKNKTKDEFIFPANTKSGHIQDHRKYIKEISDNSGVKFSLHDLRRTFATIASNKFNFNEFTIKRLLNHSQKTVTDDYIGIDIEVLREPMQKIENFLLENSKINEKKNNIMIKSSLDNTGA